MISRGLAFFFIVIVVVIIFSILFMTYYNSSNKNNSNKPAEKTEMIAHYGKSGGVELLKISNNGWRLENSNDFQVTIRRVHVSTNYGTGETTQSVWTINAESSYNLNFIFSDDGFYVYDNLGRLSGWLRPNKEPYFTKPDE